MNKKLYISQLNYLFNIIKDNKQEEIKKEVLEIYEKSLLDLTDEEVNNLSTSAKREYKILKNALTLEISKYTSLTTIKYEALSDLYNKYVNFKNSYHR